VGGLPRLALSAPSPGQDRRIFELVLSLEQLEAAFYAEAVARRAVRGELREFARIVGANEREHVAFIQKALGGAARRAPTFDFGETTADPDRFAVTAVALEDTAVAAYNGQATNLTREALAAAARIVSVEARHAAWMRDILGRPAAVRATDAPRTAARVRADIAKTGFVQGG
jgi:hypothetical protein